MKKRHKPKHVIFFDRELGVEIPNKNYNVDYATLVETSRSIEAIPVELTHSSYILYTSKTTGTPKGVIRNTGGYATALKFYQNIGIHN